METFYGSCTKLAKLENKDNSLEVDFSTPLKEEFLGFILLDETPFDDLIKVKKGTTIGVCDKYNQILLNTSEITDHVLVYMKDDNYCLAEKDTINCGKDIIKILDLLKNVIDSYLIFSTKTGVYSIHIFDEVKED